ncbi:hypothetical protein P4O66_003018 [Electrophorus voltai]|uniref:C1q domain-containing protein n=1 Tax=Electrophorus voltai TaxID=2609070 RepID=A0AAD8YSI3_9TELE|nr:hypothetical protein P4O66_003018 [Electrophorus voltai]
MTVTLKVVLLLFMWSTQAEDILTPSVDIIGELRKIKIIEDKMKKMESEIKDLKFSNTEQPKVAFSATLADTDFFAVMGPYQKDTTLVFENVLTNIGNAYDSQTGFFTSPLKGVYVLRVFSEAVGYSAQSLTAGLFKNGEHAFSTHAHQSGSFYSTSNGVSLQLETGDTICMHLYPGTWIFHNGQYHHSSFCSQLLFSL